MSYSQLFTALSFFVLHYPQTVQQLPSCRWTCAQCVHYVQLIPGDSPLFLLDSFSVCESTRDSDDVLSVEERCEVNILVSQDASDHSVVKVEAVPDTSIIVAGVELGWVPGGVDLASRVEDDDPIVFTNVLKLEQTSVNGLDTERKVGGGSGVVLGDCGGLGRGPRLNGHGQTSHLFVVDSVVDLGAEQVGIDAELDEVVNAQRSRSERGGEAAHIRSQGASDIRLSRLCSS